MDNIAPDADNAANRVRNLSIATFEPDSRAAGPYTPCFYEAVEKLGVAVNKAPHSGWWLVRNARFHDFLHIHWPHTLYSEAARYRSIRRFVGIAVALLVMRARGCRILWTVHNVYPHERCVVPILDVLMRRLLVRFGDRFFCHGEACEQAVLQAFPGMAGRTTRIEFGHWIGQFPQTMGRQAARRQLAIADDEFVFLCFGRCRRYKNIEYLVATLGKLPPNAVLIVAGLCIEPQLEADIRSAAARCGRRVILDISHALLPDREVEVYLRASDAMVAPYTEILTSGSAIMAASHGLPIIAPRKAFLMDVVTPESGVLYEMSRPDGLEDGMRRAMATKFDAARILEIARGWSWDRAARAFVEACHEALRSKPIAAPSPALSSIQGT